MDRTKPRQPANTNC